MDPTSVQFLVKYDALVYLLLVDMSIIIAFLLVQIFLLGIGTFLLGTAMIHQFQQLLPFILLLLTVMGTVTLPTMFLVMAKNPITWFITDFIFLERTRVLNY